MLIATSVHVLVTEDAINDNVVKALSELSEDFHAVVLSNNPKPSWFNAAFKGTEVEFLQVVGRQDGAVLKRFAQRIALPAHKALVLAGSRDDIAMAKNAGTVLVGTAWSEDQYVANTGLNVDEPEQCAHIARLINGWSGESWYRAEGSLYSVEAICDISTYYKSAQQQEFGKAVKAAVKDGGADLNGLLAIASCVLLEQTAQKGDLLWGVYPSSASTNDDSEVLSDFGHRLRTSTSRVHFCKRGEPLFLRHQPTVKRSASSGGDRTNPKSEIESIHLNPYYRDRLHDRNVIVLDDCSTYGVSMATAAGFLRSARAKSVSCLSIGKFGNCLGYYKIAIKSDPFAPVAPEKWECTKSDWATVQEFDGAQTALRKLLLKE